MDSGDSSKNSPSIIVLEHNSAASISGEDKASSLQVSSSPSSPSSSANANEPSRKLQAASSDYVIEGKQFGFIMASLLLAIFLAALDQTIVSVCLPSIMKEFDAESTDFSWIISSFILSSTAAGAVSGRLSDNFGRRIVMLVSVWTFLIGSILCAISQNSKQLIIFRAIQGLGGGPLITLAFVILADLLPPLQRGKWAGLIGGTFTIASAVGPLIGGGFTDSSAGWRWAFWINVPLSFLVIVFMYRYLRYQQRSVAHKVDVWGMVLICGSIVCLLLALNWGGSKYEWSHAAVVSTFEAFGFLAILFFIVQQKYADEPTIPLRLFRIRNIAVASGVSFFLMFCFLGVLSYLPIHFQVVRGRAAVDSGLQILPSVAGLFVSSIISGIAVSKTGKYRLFPIAGTSIMTLGCYLISRFDINTSGGEEFGFLFIFGLGIGLCMQVIQVASQAACDIRDIAVTTTSVRFLQNIGGTIGTTVVGSIFANHLKENMAKLGNIGLPVHGGGGEGSFSVDLSGVSAANKIKVFAAYSDSLSLAFLIVVPFGFASIIIALFLKHIPLRNSFKPDAAPAVGKPEESKQDAAVTAESPAEQELVEIASGEEKKEEENVETVEQKA